MGLLPWSFGFLLIFSLVLWTQLKTVTESSILNTITFYSMNAAGDRLGDTIEEYARQSQKEGKESLPQNVEHHRNHNRGRRTSKLVINDLFRSSSLFSEVEKKIFFRLVEILYGNQPIFEHGNNNEQVLALFEKVCKKGEELQNKQFVFRKKEDLALISLRDDPLIQNFDHSVYYHMLRGGRGEILRGSPCILEGLQYYVTFQPGTKGKILSVYLAPKKLLLALFGQEKEDVVQEILLFRQELWKEYKKETGKNAEALAAEFKQKIEPNLPGDVPSSCIDFEVSGTQPQDGVKKPFKTRV